MFETNTDVAYFFGKLTNLQTAADLRSSEALREHAMRAMHILDDAISNLDDMDYIISLLNNVGRTHVDKFGVDNAKIFWVSSSNLFIASRV